MARYHSENLDKYHFLVTGGAGFIGSNIVEYLLNNSVGSVTVLDNLSNGYLENIKIFFEYPNFYFINGDIRNLDTCKEAVRNKHFVLHQAALGSVPRSINDPVTTNEVNVSGFLNMLVASKDSTGLRRFVYAASSSTYGDSISLPKIEGDEGSPLSPYAVSKVVNEMYADVFSKVYGFHTIGLRYFNVFGPNQNPENPYAAVIPLFCKHFLENTRPKIYGDGLTSRDFTFVENVIQANIKALFVKDVDSHSVYNVACGEQTSLNEIIQILQSITGKSIEPEYESPRSGDVRHSLASIKKISMELGYTPSIKFKEGLEIVYNNYRLKKQVYVK